MEFFVSHYKMYLGVKSCISSKKMCLSLQERHVDLFELMHISISFEPVVVARQHSNCLHR